MKKTIILIAMAVLLPTVLRAQLDTVQWGSNRYHYSVWYDTLPAFFNTWSQYEYPSLRLFPWGASFPHYVPGMPQHVDRPTQVYGVAVTEPDNYADVYFHTDMVRNPWYIEEYVYLFQKVGDTMVLLDSARWDTITPKVMKLALNADTQRFGFRNVKVYEAMFKEPVTVDSVFYTVTTNHGAEVPCGSAYYEYEYLPVIPIFVFHTGAHYTDTSWCPKPSWWEIKEWNMQTRQWSAFGYTYGAPIFGLHFPIVDYAELIVESADTAMGTAGPVAHVARNTTQSIWARPRRGYKFSHWQEDWSPYATRSVYIAQDTTRYTAVFEPAARYRVEGRSDDEATGYVTVGDSVYYEGDTAVLEAYAAEGMKFRHWSNGSTENPLRLVVTCDTVLTAHFSPLELYRVRGVSNNEAKGYVVVDDSIHYEDDTAVLSAFPEAGYVFSSWSTGDTVNPLQIVVESDTVVMAFFAGHSLGIAAAEGEDGAFVLSPNPARGQATVTLTEGFEGGTLAVRDAAGREVLRRELARGTRTCTLDVSGLPSGTYFVTLTTAKGTGTQKLIIN